MFLFYNFHKFTQLDIGICICKLFSIAQCFTRFRSLIVWSRDGVLVLQVSMIFNNNYLKIKTMNHSYILSKSGNCYYVSVRNIDKKTDIHTSHLLNENKFRMDSQIENSYERNMKANHLYSFCKLNLKKATYWMHWIHLLSKIYCSISYI